MKTDCIAQGAPLNALWWSKWDGNPKKRRFMYTCSWFTLPYSRNYHNIAKQLYSNKNKNKFKNSYLWSHQQESSAKGSQSSLCLALAAFLLPTRYQPRPGPASPKILFSPRWVEAPLHKGTSHQCQVAGVVLTLRWYLYFSLFPLSPTNQSSGTKMPAAFLPSTEAHISLKTSRWDWPGSHVLLSGSPANLLLPVHHRASYSLGLHSAQPGPAKYRILKGAGSPVLG